MAIARPAADEMSLVKAGQKFVDQLLKRGINGFGPFKSAADSAAEALRIARLSKRSKRSSETTVRSQGPKGSSQTPEAS